VTKQAINNVVALHATELDAEMQFTIKSTIATLQGIKTIGDGQSDAIEKYSQALAASGDVSTLLDSINNESVLLAAEMDVLMLDEANHESFRHFYLEGYIRGVRLVAITVLAKVEEYEAMVEAAAANELPDNVTVISVAVTPTMTVLPVAEVLPVATPAVPNKTNKDGFGFMSGNIRAENYHHNGSAVVH
jgi:hypothetical protein